MGRSHHGALLLDLAGALGAAVLGVQLQRDGAVLLHVEQLLEQLLDVVVGLGRRLHVTAAPALRLRLALGLRHLPRRLLVHLVAHQHHRHALQGTALDLEHLLPDWPQLLQRLSGGHREHEDECVPLGDGQPLHRWKLVRARRVRDLQCADVLIARDHLRIK